MIFTEDIIELPDDVFRLLRDFIRDYCGLYFDDTSKYLLEKRLSRRVRLHQLNTFLDYYRFLSYDRRREAELVEVVDSLTTNETYFFREEAQLRAFRDEILPGIIGPGGQKTFKVWSAGCSTGEEPYTIGMILSEAGFLGGAEVEIIGSDINQKVLTAARRGVYRRGSFRAIRDDMMRKYFKEESPGSFRISDDIKKLVTFSHLNLFDPYRLSFLKGFDVIFCRNVIIYFDPESKKKLIKMFYDKLSPGGYLLLGHAESLLNVTTAFRLVHLRNDMVYQKPVSVREAMPIEK